MYTDIQLLAQQGPEFGDWIQIIVVVLVVGGSILGPISKKLIEKFGAEKPGESDAARPARTSRPQPSTPRRQMQPQHSVARPMPPGARPQAMPPSSQPLPLPEEIFQPVAPPRGMVPQGGSAEQPERPPPRPPTAAPVSVPRHMARPSVSVRAKQQHRPAPAPRPKQPVHDRVEEHLGRLESALDDETAQVDVDIEERLGHIESELEAPDATTKARGRTDKIGHQTRRSLRHAIVMREILGPPIALRPPE